MDRGASPAPPEHGSRTRPVVSLARLIARSGDRDRVARLAMCRTLLARGAELSGSDLFDSLTWDESGEATALTDVLLALGATKHLFSARQLAEAAALVSRGNLAAQRVLGGI